MMSNALEQAPVEAPAVWFERYLPLVALFWQNRRFIAKAAMIGLIAATILAFVIPARYESKVTLMPPDIDTMSSMPAIATMAAGALDLGSGGASEAATPGGIGGLASTLLGTKTAGAPFLAILRSRTVEDDLINRFDLRRVYWKSLYKDAREKLETRTDLDEDKKTGVISITVSDHDPGRAHDMAAAYVEELNKSIASMNTSAAHQECVFLESRLVTVKRDLDFATVELSHFSSKNATIDVDDEGRALMDAAATLQGDLIAAESDLRAVEISYTSDNIRVKSAKARVDELNKKLAELSGADRVNTTGDLRSGENYPSLRKLPLLGATYLDLYRRMKIQEAAYEFLTKQYELAKLEEARSIPVVKVLDTADVAEEHAFPPRVAMIVLGALFAFCCGMTWLAGPWRYWDLAQFAKKIQSPGSNV
jgi:capsule polysaccharide export protein KpsE/RkpR